MATMFRKQLARMVSDKLPAFGWTVAEVTALGARGIRKPVPDVEHLLDFNVVHDSKVGVWFFPWLGVRFRDMADCEAMLLGSQPNYAAYCAFVALRDVAPRGRVQPGGWSFSVEELAEAASKITAMVDEVAHLVDESGFFDAIRTVADLVTAAEAKRWPLIQDSRTYLVALIVVGRIKDAKTFAQKARDRYFAAAQEKGGPVREHEYALYDRIIALAEH